MMKSRRLPVIGFALIGTILLSGCAMGDKGGPTPTPTPPATHGVNLAWTASPSVVIGYNVYRSSQSGGPYQPLNATLVASPAYTDSNVQAGQRYFYVVTAMDSSGGESSFSNEASATVPSP
jgi:hypothetical protein